MATEMLQYLDHDGLDETVLNIGQIKTSLEEEMQNLPYARPDGLYPDMTVGAVIGADSTAQWATRESTGSGAATVRSVQGAAVAFNQMCPAMSDSSWALITSQVVAKSVTDEVMTLSFSSGSYTSAGVRSNKGPAVVNGHKYYIAYDVCDNTTGQPTMVNLNGSVTLAVYGTSEETSGSEWVRISGMFTANADSQYTYICLYVNSVSSGGVKFRNVICIDLTQMFGSGNEPTTVEEFERMYPQAYYPYSTPTLKPVQIAGIASTDAQGGELDAIEWTAQTLRAAGSVRDELTSDELVTRVGVVDLGTIDWFSDGGVVARNSGQDKTFKLSGEITCIGYTLAPTNSTGGDWPDKSLRVTNSQALPFLRIKNSEFENRTSQQIKEMLAGVYLFYELTTPTTTPISPALPMTYRVEQGGSESIIVPTGEVSATPVLTVAEPVNAGDEFARIWAAIESLGYTRNTAQLSRPVSLTDIGSIDEAQKDTTDIAEIDTTKEVQE